MSEDDGNRAHRKLVKMVRKLMREAGPELKSLSFKIEWADGEWLEHTSSRKDR